MHRVFQTSYSKNALEAWLGYLAMDWEKQFEKEELLMARDIYRQQSIRSVDISMDAATITMKVDKQERYVIIEPKKNYISIRGSGVIQFFNKALAAAGLYEIEELLANELTSLPVEEKLQDFSIGTAQLAVQNPDFKRELVLEFYVEEQSVLFRPYWKHNDEKTPALTTPSNNSKERQLLIQLALQAKKSKFKPKIPNNCYVLRDLEYVPHFLKEELPLWHFATFTIDKQVEIFKKTIGTLVTQFEARGVDRFTFKKNIVFSFHVDGQKPTLLDDIEIQTLIRNSHKPFVLLKKRGIIHLEEQPLYAIDQLKDEVFERYLLFSLYETRKIDISEDPELQEWKHKVLYGHEDFEENQKNLPSFLRDYQKKGVGYLRHLCKLGCHPLLADEMGLGKTLQILSLIYTYSNNKKPSLIICPASVTTVWQNEIDKFFPSMESKVLSNNNKTIEPNTPIIWITSYTQARRNKDLLVTLNFEYIILDEAQYIKNPDAKMTHACLQLKGEHRIALTGTPLENHPRDIWSLFQFLMPGLLGSRKKFETFYNKEPLEAINLLKKQISPFILRRTKEIVAKDLPSKTEMILNCPLNSYQKNLYNHYCRETLSQLGDDIQNTIHSQTFSFLTLLMRLRQVCCDPQIIKPMDEINLVSGKMQALIDKLPDLLEAKHKIVIFSQFTSFLDCIQKVLQKNFPQAPLFKLTGKTLDRGKVVYDFQKHTGEGIFLISLKAGGTGLTLSTADYVFLMDPWWNPAVEAQAVDRVHRIGQKRPVFIYKMIAQGTLEERIQSLQLFKNNLSEDILNNVQGLEAVGKHYTSLKELIEYRSESYDI